MKTFGKAERARPRTIKMLWMIPGALALFLVAPGVVSAQVQSDTLKTVTVQAVCTNEGGRLGLGRVTIDPFTLYVPVPSPVTDDNVEVEWVLQTSSTDIEVQSPDSIAIQAADNGRWPFGLTRLRARGAGRAQGARAKMLGTLPRRGGQGAARRVQANERFKYNVIVYCTLNGVSYEVSIDPDIDTGGGV